LEKGGKVAQISSNVIARLGGASAVLGGLLCSAKAFYDRNGAQPWLTDVTADYMLFVVPLHSSLGSQASTPAAEDG
jgi:hypothetical protein